MDETPASPHGSGSTPPGMWQPPSPEDMQAMLSQYQFEALLGRGGMGAVYKAVQVSLDRAVAIKVLPGDLIGDGETNFVERFKNEARTMAKLSHPGIVNLFSFGETRTGLLYFVMEFIDGMDVAQVIAAGGRLPPEQALAITAHVCDALHYAHTHGVIHRDIKPANVLISMEGQVKVADFGLAKAIDPGVRGLTCTNMVMGTPDFIAPEALIDGTLADGRADIYAVGVMLYKMLTGTIPRGMWTMPSEMVQTDPRFDEIIGRAMQVEPDNRHQTAMDLRRELDVILTVPYVMAEDRQPSAAIPKQHLALIKRQQSVVPNGGPARTIKKVQRQPQRVVTYVERRSAMPPVLITALLAVVGFFVWQKLGKSVPVPAGSSTVASVPENTTSPETANAPVPQQQPPAASPLTGAITSLPTTGWQSIDIPLTDRNTSLADGWKNLQDDFQPEMQARDLAVRAMLRLKGGVGYPLRFRESRVTGFLRYGIKINGIEGKADLIRRAEAGSISFPSQTTTLGTARLPRVLGEEDEFELAFIAQGELITVFFDGTPLIQARDIHCPGDGFAIGSSAELDVKDLQWMPLSPATGSMRVLEIPPGSPPSGWMDALALVEPETHAERSTWEKTADGLKWVTNDRLPVYGGTIRLPVPVGDRYAVAVEFTPTDDSGGLSVVLPLGGTTTACWFSETGFAGVAKVDGLDPQQLPAPYSSPFNLESGRRYRAQATVKPVSEGVDIEFHVDDQLVGIYRGPASRLTCSTMWQQPADRTFALLGANRPVTFHRAAVWSLPEVEPAAPKGDSATELLTGTFGGHRYQIVEAKGIPLSDAVARAESMGGHLVTITSSSENEFIMKMCQPVLTMIGRQLWIAGHRAAQGTEGWTWTTGEPFSFPGPPTQWQSSTMVGDAITLVGGPSVIWNDFEHPDSNSNVGGAIYGFMVEWDEDVATSMGPPPVAPPSPASPTAPLATVIDLLASVDVKRDAVKGTWERKPEGIVTPRSTNSQVLEFNQVAPEEYDFEIEFTVTGGTREVVQILPLQGRSILWKMCPSTSDPAAYMFGPFLDEQAIFISSSTEARAVLPRLKVGQRYRSLVEVRKGTLRAILDGREILMWNGDFARLSVGSETPVWALRDQQHPGIASFTTDVTFHKAELRPRGFISERLTEIETQFKASWKRDVTDSAAGKAVADLDAKYLAALDRALADATKAGKLDDVNALNEEKKRIEDHGPLPAADPVNIVASLGRLRATYRKSVAPLLKQRDATAEPVYARYDRALAALEDELTRQKAIGDAQHVRSKRDKLDLLRHPEKTSLAATSVSPVQAPAAPAASSSTLSEAVLKETPPKPFTPEEAIRWALSLNGSATILRGREKSEVLSVAMMPKGKYTLIGLKVGENQLQHVVSLAGLSNLSELRDLVLDSNLLTDAGLAFLPRLPKLAKLGLHGCGLSDVGLAHLARQPALTELDVGYNRISGTGLGFLATTSSLKSLSIGSSSLTDEGIAHIARCTSLAALDLSSSGTSKVTSLAPLAGVGTLRELRLLHDTTDILAQSLATVTQITALDFTYSPISDAALESVRSMSSLREVTLNSCGNLTDAGYRNLVPLGKSLTSLNAAHTSLGDAAFAEICNNLTELAAVDISFTAVSSAGLDGLTKLKKLRRLIVHAQQCDDKGLRVLGRIVNDPKIETFGVSDFEKLDEKRKEAVSNSLTRWAF